MITGFMLLLVSDLEADCCLEARRTGRGRSHRRRSGAVGEAAWLAQQHHAKVSASRLSSTSPRAFPALDDRVTGVPERGVGRGHARVLSSSSATAEAHSTKNAR